MSDPRKNRQVGFALETKIVKELRKSFAQAKRFPCSGNETGDVLARLPNQSLAVIECKSRQTLPAPLRTETNDRCLDLEECPFEVSLFVTVCILQVRDTKSYWVWTDGQNPEYWDTLRESLNKRSQAD